MSDKEPKVATVREAVLLALREQQRAALRAAKQRARDLAPKPPLPPKEPK